jgi:hypothetical protein
LTPFERRKACAEADREQIAKLEVLRATLNPFALKRSIEKKRRRIWRASAGRRLKAAA